MVSTSANKPNATAAKLEARRKRWKQGYLDLKAKKDAEKGLLQIGAFVLGSWEMQTQMNQMKRNVQTLKNDMREMKHRFKQDTDEFEQDIAYFRQHLKDDETIVKPDIESPDGIMDAPPSVSILEDENENVPPTLIHTVNTPKLPLPTSFTVNNTSAKPSLPDLLSLLTPTSKILNTPKAIYKAINDLSEKDRVIVKVSHTRSNNRSFGFEITQISKPTPLRQY